MSEDNAGMRKQKDENLEKCKPVNPKYTVTGLHQALYLRNARLHLKPKLSPIYLKTWVKRCLAFPPLHHNEPLYTPTAQALACTDSQQVTATSSLYTIPGVMCLQFQFSGGIMLWPTSPAHCPALSKYLLFPGVPETFFWGENGLKVLTKTGCPTLLTLKRWTLPFLRQQKLRKYLHL